MHRWQGKKKTENEKLLGKKPKNFPLGSLLKALKSMRKNMKKLSWWVYFGLNAKDFLSSISNMTAIVTG